MSSSNRYTNGNVKMTSFLLRFGVLFTTTDWSRLLINYNYHYIITFHTDTSLYLSPSRIPRLRNFDRSAKMHRIACFVKEKSWKSPLSMALGKKFQFLNAECPFLSIKFPFPEHRILGGLYLEQFLSAKLAFSECNFFYFWAQNFNFCRVEFPAWNSGRSGILMYIQ